MVVNLKHEYDWVVKRLHVWANTTLQNLTFEYLYRDRLLSLVRMGLVKPVEGLDGTGRLPNL